MSIVNQMSIIQEGAAIGEGTTVGEQCHIGSNVIIGKNNKICSGVVISGNTTIGDNNHISSYSVLGTAPQDIKTTSQSTMLNIGDNNYIGEQVLISAGTDHGGKVTNIGSGNKLMSGIHIGHDVQMKDNCTMETGSALGGHVIVGNNVYFSKLSAIHQFVELGDFSSLGKDAAVTQDIPPYCIAKGNRAKITGPNLKTLVEKFSQNEVDDIINAFGILSNESRSPKESASAALTESNSELVKNLYSFIIKSKRGIPFRRKVNVN